MNNSHVQDVTKQLIGKVVHIIDYILVEALVVNLMIFFWIRSPIVKLENKLKFSCILPI